MFQLWLDELKLIYSEFSFLNFTSDNPTMKFADSILFYNKPPKEDFFDGRMDISMGLRVVVEGEGEKSFSFSQNNVSLSGKVTSIKCRGGLVTQVDLMREWLELLASDNYKDYPLMRYPIEAKYKISQANLNTEALVEKVQSLVDLSDCNPKFLQDFILNIVKDKRFWGRPKIFMSGNFPTTCYLPVDKQVFH